MMPLPLSRIAQWTGGRLHGDDVPGFDLPGFDLLIDAVATDTRTLDASDGRAALFVALKGERFDGHDHVALGDGDPAPGAPDFTWNQTDSARCADGRVSLRCACSADPGSYAPLGAAQLVNQQYALQAMLCSAVV